MKIHLVLFLIFSLLFFFRESTIYADFEDIPSIEQEEVLRAKIISIKQIEDISPQEEEEIETDDSSIETKKPTTYVIGLLGLEGSLRNRRFTIEQQNSSSLPVYYSVGDIVFVAYNDSDLVKNRYTIVETDRSFSLLVLVLFFVLFVIFIGSIHGLKALLSLAISLFLLFLFIIPMIVSGYNPTLVCFVGIILFVIPSYIITHGVNSITVLSIATTVVCITLTLFISQFFIDFLDLSGFTSHESLYITANIRSTVIDMRGILLIGIIIGTLGVLDDVVVSQVAIVQELCEANPSLSRGELFSRSMRVGRHHAGSMVNTLVLAYAGSSLPLFIIFSMGVGYFSSTSLIVNHEMIATEIARSFLGSIGLLTSLPLASFLGSFFLPAWLRRSS